MPRIEAGPTAEMSNFYQQLTTMGKLGLIKPDEAMLTRLEKGSLTTTDIEFLKEHLGTVEVLSDIMAPSLSAPDQKLVSNFIASLRGSSMPINTGTGNAYLNCSAILMLFIMTSNVISVMSQIQQVENLYKAQLALVQKDMAVAASDATKKAGEIAAKEESAQAAKSMADASAALVSVVMTATISLYSKMKYNEQLNAEQAEFNKAGKALTVKDKMDIQSRVDTQTNILKGQVDGLINMMKSTYEAQMHLQLSKLHIDKAVQDALSQLLSKLVDIVAQTAQMLGKSADTDCAQTIKAVLDSFQSYVRIFGEIGAKG